MPQTGITDKEVTVRAWAEIVLNMWRDRLVMLKAWDSGELYHSLENTLFSAAGGDVDKIEFAFKLYGIFVDMGVGREFSQGNPGDLGFAPARERKRWYSGIFYREVMRLREILIEKYGDDYASQVVLALHPVKDLKHARAKGSL